MRETAPVLVEKRDSVVILKFNRPDDQNRVTQESLKALTAALDEIEADSAARVLILAGNRDCFCGGGRIDASSSEAEKDSFSAGIRDVQRRLTKLRIPVIAAVEGDCLAGGNDFLAAADIAVAREGVLFSFPEVLHGTFPVMVMIRTIDVLPKKKALACFYTGEPLSAQEALAYGMITCVVDDAKFWETVMHYATAIASKDATMISMGRRAYYDMLPLTYNDRVEYGRVMLSRVLTAKNQSSGQ